MNNKPPTVITLPGATLVLTNTVAKPPPVISSATHSTEVCTASPPFSEIRDHFSERPLRRPKRIRKRP